MSKLTNVYQAVVDASIPLSWFNFKRLVGSGDVFLKGPEKPLVSWLVFSYALCTVTFVGQLVYYSSLTTTDFVVSQEYNLAGHVCRPLQNDPEYGLSITYDECMAIHEPVSYSTLTKFGTFDPTGRVIDKRTGEHLLNNNGPWNFTPSFPVQADWNAGQDSPLWYGIETPLYNTPTTYFHKPFPKLSQQAYTYHPTCTIPNYPGFPNHYYAGSVFENTLLFAYELALGNAQVAFQGYGPYALCNKDPRELGIQPDRFGFHLLKDHNFHPAVGTDFVSRCFGNFTSQMQSDLYTNGGYVSPHVYAGSVSFIDGDGQVVKSDHRTVGMTPMYPKSYWDQHNLPQMKEGTFFGIPRCDFYERQMSKEAYEFVYSHKNCHPCDGFKFNTPFHCERRVRKTAGEIIGLSVSNTLALFGFLVAVGPQMIRALKIGEDVTAETTT